MSNMIDGDFSSIPDSWEFQPLGNLAKTSSGGTPSRNRPDFYEGKIPWVKSGELGDGFISRTEETISQSALDGSAAKIFPQGTLLIALYGATAGKTAILNIPAATNQAVCAIFPDMKKLSPAYLRHYLIGIRRRILDERHGGAQPNISQQILQNIPVVVPSLDEQCSIAGILDEIKNAIEIQDKTIATLKELKAATMERLFSRGASNADTKESEIGSIPSHWDVKRIDEIAILTSGGTPSKSRPDWWKGSIPWASPKDMKVPRLYDVTDKITKEAAESSSRIAPAKSIFVVIRGMILIRDVPMAITEVPMAFNQDMKAIMPDDSVDPDFLFFAMQNRRSALFQEISTSAHGTRRMSTSVVESMLIALPKDKQEQIEIRDAIRQIDDQMATKERKLLVLHELFSSALEVLMSGSLRTTPLLGD